MRMFGWTLLGCLCHYLRMGSFRALPRVCLACVPPVTISCAHDETGTEDQNGIQVRSCCTWTLKPPSIIQTLRFENLIAVQFSGSTIASYIYILILNFAIAQENNSLTESGNMQVMRDQDNRHAKFMTGFYKKCHHLLAGLAVQIACGFIR